MFWDNVAGAYDLFVNVINRKTHKVLRLIVSDLIDPGDEVLECACGTGLLSAVIAPKCRHLTATDYSVKMLQRAVKNCAAHQNVSFGYADITSLGFPDGAFDKVVAGNVIHLLDEPLKALNELDRVCRPGGKL
ncbi:MAG: methyltransferase domain-containing protein, partial [Clostridiales bacterium]|nr:methyltransferase domain-containing protein [Clostridiales bacterium]